MKLFSNYHIMFTTKFTRIWWTVPEILMLVHLMVTNVSARSEREHWWFYQYHQFICICTYLNGRNILFKLHIAWLIFTVSRVRLKLTTKMKWHLGSTKWHTRAVDWITHFIVNSKKTIELLIKMKYTYLWSSIMDRFLHSSRIMYTNLESSKKLLNPTTFLCFKLRWIEISWLIFSRWLDLTRSFLDTILPANTWFWGSNTS